MSSETKPLYETEAENRSARHFAEILALGFEARGQLAEATAIRKLADGLLFLDRNNKPSDQREGKR